MDILNYIVPSKNFKHEEEYLDVLFRTQLKFEKNVDNISFYKKKDIDLLNVIESENFVCFRFGDNSNKFVIEHNDNIVNIKTKYEENFNTKFLEHALYNCSNICNAYLDHKSPLIIGIIGSVNFITEFFLYMINRAFDDFNKQEKKLYYLEDTKYDEDKNFSKYFLDLFTDRNFGINNIDYIYFLHEKKGPTLKNIPHSIEIKIKVNQVRESEGSVFLEFGTFKLNEKPEPNFFKIAWDVKKKIDNVSGQSVLISNIINHGEYIEKNDIYYYLTIIVRFKAIVRYSKYRQINSIQIRDNIDIEELKKDLDINDILFNNRTEKFEDEKLYDLYKNFSNYAITSPDFIINKIRFEDIDAIKRYFVVNSKKEEFDIYELIDTPIDLFNKINKFEYRINISIKIALILTIPQTKNFLDTFYKLSITKQSNITEIIFSPQMYSFALYRNYIFDRKHKNVLQNN